MSRCRSGWVRVEGQQMVSGQNGGKMVLGLVKDARFEDLIIDSVLKNDGQYRPQEREETSPRMAARCPRLLGECIRGPLRRQVMSANRKPLRQL